ncbi:MAG TPA: ABC transporter ATP-binding protein [Ktedonobacteraceae bacterium]|nr:ABC transporter ATP-binding protein [Ktedonobacteraceae bacterium]
MPNSEFSVANAHKYNQSSAIRWIISHVARFKGFFTSFLLATIISNIFASEISTLTGNAFNVILQPSVGQYTQLLHISLWLLAVVLLSGVLDMVARLSIEFVGNGLERDCRNELYSSLMGKSQTFHNRQRVGDIMARSVNDIRQVEAMIVPAFDTMFDSFMALVIPLIFIAFINLQLLIVPLIFTGVFVWALRDYMRRLQPVSNRMRAEFGQMNATLTETVTGIEVVKATAQEEQERGKFRLHSSTYWASFVRNGFVQALYLPILLLTIATVCAFVHGLWLISIHQLTIGGLVAYMGLLSMMRFPVNMSTWTFDLMQLGLSGADRILKLLREETELDENTEGYNQPIRGEIVFENVTFSYGGAPILKNISFTALPGQTVAIVGQTGAGKSTLTKLVNRIYDVDSGRILVDGVDVRDWSLDALRSQISTIEQDIFLFSRTVAENISYSRGRVVDAADVERVARDAQAHDFIMNFKDGYETVIGERGVTLSGGQRQRLAIARALLTDPRILVLDGSTSAIDSATEDEIQKAIRRLLQDRTTLLITHRLSQIRWADKVLVIRQGELIDEGTHKELLARCDLYRRIFTHYEPGSSGSDSNHSNQRQEVQIGSNGSRPSSSQEAQWVS